MVVLTLLNDDYNLIVTIIKTHRKRAQLNSGILEFGSQPMAKKMRINSMKNRLTKGQSLLEMSLLVPILLVLVIGAIEVGRLFYTKLVITNAAREGAYYLITHRSDYNVGTGSAPNTVMVAQAEASNSGISNVTVSITPKNCCTLGVFSVEVTVETMVDDLLILSFLGNTLSLGATNYEQFPLSSTVEMMVQ